MSNKVGRIVQTQRTTKHATMYKVDILTTDLLSTVETVMCSGLDSDHEDGELVVMLEVQGKLFITSKASTGVSTLQVYGKWQPENVGDLEDFGYNDGTDEENNPSPDTLMYVAKKIKDTEALEAIKATPDAPILDYPKEEDFVLVRVMDGEAENVLIKKDQLIFAYAVDDLYFTVIEPKAGDTVPCEILTKVGGMEYTYTANIYVDGIEPGVTPTVGEVEQISINADQTIPSGTWAMASLNKNGIWYVQVAVWQ